MAFNIHTGSEFCVIGRCCHNTWQINCSQYAVRIPVYAAVWYPVLGKRIPGSCFDLNLFVWLCFQFFLFLLRFHLVSAVCSSFAIETENGQCFIETMSTPQKGTPRKLSTPSRIPRPSRGTTTCTPMENYGTPRRGALTPVKARTPTRRVPVESHSSASKQSENDRGEEGITGKYLVCVVSSVVCRP